MIHRILSLGLLIIAALCAISCNSPSGQLTANSAIPTTPISNEMIKKYRFPYNLSNENEKFKLPGKLTEVSGMDWISESEVVMVQDEKGTLYLSDIQKEEVFKKIEFGKDGDYEGIEMVGDDVWVLRSDGKLYQIKNRGKKKQDVEKFKTFLGPENDAEGLGYDKAGNRLLIACKGSPGMAPELKGKKAIYAFSLKNQVLMSTPAYVIGEELVRDWAKIKGNDRLLDKFMPHFDGSGEKIFQPSGVAIHPRTGHIYVISAVGKLLVVLDRKSGRLLTIQELTDKDFKQPEGITFLPDGTLLISNEGRKGKGNILSFVYQK